jgi:hypothetical protein
MIPPNPASTDPLGYSTRAGDAIASAVQNAGTKNVVALGSVGADKASGTGPAVGLHNLEQKLSQISSANVLHLCAGYFMENTLPQVNAIRQMNSVATGDAFRRQREANRRARTQFFLQPAATARRYTLS